VLLPPAHDGVLKFMDKVVARFGNRETHFVLDNLSTHSGDDIDAWLAKHPSYHVPLHAHRQLMIEPRRDLVQHHHGTGDRRGTFTSLRVLINTINSYIENWSRDAKPFTWTVPRETSLLP
jgi:hypothetical protein